MLSSTRPPADVQGVLDQIQGNPATVACDASGACSFDIRDFFVQLTAPCAVAGCLVPEYTLESVQFAYSGVCICVCVCVCGG